MAELTEADLICPVLVNRAPARYKKALADDALVLIDGCPTRCATKLAAELQAKAQYRVLVSEELKARGVTLDKALRLDSAALALADTIARHTVAALESPAGAAGAVPEPVASWDPPTDFAIVVHDKYEFRIPKTGYYFNENDAWARIAGGRARVGISDYMQQSLTDITYFDPPEVGAVVEQFGELGSVESTKASFDILSPVSGTVVAINQEAADSPELINEDSYGRGWLVEMELSAWEEDLELLIGGSEYAATVERKAAEA